MLGKRGLDITFAVSIRIGRLNKTNYERWYETEFESGDIGSCAVIAGIMVIRVDSVAHSVCQQLLYAMDTTPVLVI